MPQLPHGHQSQLKARVPSSEAVHASLASAGTAGGDGGLSAPPRISGIWLAPPGPASDSRPPDMRATIAGEDERRPRPPPGLSSASPCSQPPRGQARPSPSPYRRSDALARQEITRV